MSDMAQVRAAGAEVSVTRAVPVAPADARSRYVRAAVSVLREQAWFIAVVLLYLLAGFAVGKAYGQDIRLGMYNDVHLVLYANFALFWVIFRIVWSLAKHRPERPLRFVWTDLKTGYFAPRRLLSALPAFVLLPLALSMTTSLKRMIPLISPFSWDPVLMKIDWVLHGGNHPWELLQPVVGLPLATAVISNAYALPWYTLVLFMQFWHTFTLDRRRTRFLITYVLCWALMGNGLATVLSSAGPVYYGYLFDGPNPFAPLMSYLESVSDSFALPSYLAQQYLWENYQKDFLRLGSGISAMPSLHISMGLLLVLVTWHLHRIVRVATIAFLIVLQIGAVHLGWHYAVDGYVALIGTGLIWWAVGRALVWRGRPADRRRGAGLPPGPGHTGPMSRGGVRQC
ncbi:MAG: phosphatase PAP2 family protein [Kiloniellaceae bacterium]